MDRCTLNKGAFAFKIVPGGGGGGGGGALKWPLKGGSRLIEVAATAGLTVLSPSFPIVWVGCGVGAVVTNDLCITKLYAWLMMDSAGLLWYFLIILTIIKISLI